MVLHVLLFISYHKRYLLYPPSFISKQQWLLQSYPCLFWENGYTQCPCWRNIWDLIISRVPDLRLAIVNKISWVNNAFNRSFNTREGWGTHCSPNCENQIIIVIAKPFPSFWGTVGVSFFSSNEIPKNVHGDAESCFVHHRNKIFNHHHPHP